MKFLFSVLTVIIFNTNLFSQLSQTIDVTQAPYNATPDDLSSDHLAFQNAIAFLADNNGGVLIVPAGEFRFNARVVADLKGKNIIVRGSGKGVTKLTTTAFNSNGVFYFNNTTTSNGNILEIYDLSFYAGKANAGTALFINNTNYGNNKLIAKNIVVQSKNETFHYFKNGFVTKYLTNPILEDVFFKSNFIAAGYTFSLNYALRMIHVDSPTFKHCYFKYAVRGVSVNHLIGKLIIEDCISVETKFGYEITAVANSGAKVYIKDSHVNSTNIGVFVKNLNLLQLKNIAAYAAYDDYTTVDYADFQIVDSKDITIK